MVVVVEDVQMVNNKVEPDQGGAEWSRVEQSLEECSYMMETERIVMAFKERLYNNIYWNPNSFVTSEPMQRFRTLAAFFLVEK